MAAAAWLLEFAFCVTAEQEMAGRQGRGDGGKSGGGERGGRRPADAGRKPHPAGQRPAAPRAPAAPARKPARPLPRAVQVPDAEPSSGAREVKLHGVNACRAFVAHRREQIVRAYFNESVGRRHFASLMKWLAAQRLAYHLVTDDELERITGSGHHEGVCLLVRAEPPRDAQAWLREYAATASTCVLALENVGNPHNLGAILRVAAHFGVPAVLVPDAKSLAGGSAVRTAEGGAEFVEVLDAADFAGTVRAFRKAGWRVVTTSSHKGSDVFRSALPAKCLVLFGEESAGLSADMLASGDVCVRIPGTGRIESLNVSVAAGILVGEWWRQQAPR
jgi:TrmH RNA methyltransferase